MPLMRLSLLAAVGLLAGCATSEFDRSSPTRHLTPLADATRRALEKKGMSPSSPMLVRIYKKESELEVWKQAADGRFKHFKTYKICKWSGELGPKIAEGDKQAPEGFYAVTPAQMNPRSNYYLSFNLGYPNAFDKAHGRTGTNLMVHGDCLSAGCYAMTDEQMQEIYALARESFAGGQSAFQVQALPFRMTPRNLAAHRGDPNMPFWKNLKEGSDHFEVAKTEPRVAVCEKRYVFNPEDGVSNARFSPRGRCPSFEVPKGIASAVAAKQKKDEAAIRLAAVELKEEKEAAIEAAKPNELLSAIAGASRAEAQAELKEEKPSKADPAPAREAAKKSDPRATQVPAPEQRAGAEEEPSGNALSRFWSKIIGRDQPADEPAAN